MADSGENEDVVIGMEQNPRTPSVDPAIHQMSLDVQALTIAIRGITPGETGGLIKSVADLASAQEKAATAARMGRSDIYDRIAEETKTNGERLDEFEAAISEKMDHTAELAIQAHTWARGLSWFVGMVVTLGGGSVLVEKFFG